MEYTQLTYEQQGPVTVITLNRPHVKNCISPTLHQEMCHAFDRFRCDDQAYVAVLTGAGDSAFCAGGDLKAGLDSYQPEAFMDPTVAPNIPTTPQQVEAHARGEAPGVLGPSRWTDIYKPVIAAVNGIAYAGGFEWACFADIRVVEEHASFGITCRRWNIGLADGGSQRLPRIIGMGRAMELIITGRVIDAEEAQRIGLANEVVPKGEGLKRAIELGQFIATLPQGAIRADKEAAVRGFGEPLREGLRIEAECFARYMNEPKENEEFLEGLRKFNERDHPDRVKGQAKTPGIVRAEMED